MLQLTRDITGSFAKGEYTRGVFIDLCKDFGTVDHQTLIIKLQYYGIDGTALKWFKSYLSNRIYPPNSIYPPKKYQKTV